MSLRAMIWSFDQHDTTPTQRLLLLALANYANADNETWPKVTTLEQDTGFGKSTIYRERSALCDIGLLTKVEGTRDKYVINVDSQSENSQSGNEIPRAGKRLHKGTEKEPDAVAPAAEKDDSQVLYDRYIEIVRKGDYGRLPQRIPSGYRKDAAAALADWPMDSLVTALRGFVNYRAKKAGSDRFSDIFGTHIRQSRTERIEFWISQAGDASGLHGFTSDQRRRIANAVRDVQRAFGSSDPDTLATGEEALTYLRSLGIEAHRDADGRWTFPGLGAEA